MKYSLQKVGYRPFELLRFHISTAARREKASKHVRTANTVPLRLLRHRRRRRPHT